MVQQAKKMTKETMEFIKRLALFVLCLIALLPGVAGVLTVLNARTHVVTITSVATIFSGLSTAVLCFILLHKVLMRKTA